jgi:hypothetical protein
MHHFEERISSHGVAGQKCSTVAQEVPEKNTGLWSETSRVVIHIRVHPFPVWFGGFYRTQMVGPMPFAISPSVS